jgi:hypothetical protein
MSEIYAAVMLRNSLCIWCGGTLRARRPSPVEERCHALRQGYRETAAARGLHQTRRLAEASSSLQHPRAGSTPISSRGPPTGFAPHGVLKIHLIEVAKLPVSSALAISSLGSLCTPSKEAPRQRRALESGWPITTLNDRTPPTAS